MPPFFDFDSQPPKLLANHAAPMPDLLREKLHHLSVDSHTLHEYALTEHALSQSFAQCILALLKSGGLSPEQIALAGIHGQTLLHQTHDAPALTLQLLDPNLISAQCGLAIVSDFRRRDLAEGGEGAPLAPLVHQHLFHCDTENRAIVNIGGIANVTLLPKDGSMHGFDTGPGGGLLDEWTQLHKGESHDRDGEWARSGTVQDALLEEMLRDPFFAQSPPKSTSREYFGRTWAEGILSDHPASQEDVQATLTELTARSISDALNSAKPEIERVLLCGGGARNVYLKERLANRMEVSVEPTDAYGLDAEWVECCLFAHLAWLHDRKEAAELTGITGSRKAAVLGATWPA